MGQEEMIEEILRHLPRQTQWVVVRRRVDIYQQKSGGGQVSHKCCNMYGRPASETVGMLDCYTDMNAGLPDKEQR